MLQNLRVVAMCLFLICVTLSVTMCTLVTTLVLVELISMKFCSWELRKFPAPNAVLGRKHLTDHTWCACALYTG